MPATLTPTTRYRYIGVTDECVECQQCGRVDLKSTVVLAILDADGNTEDITYYGSTCAARALAIRGGGAKVRKAAENAAYELRETASWAREVLAHYGVAEDGTVADIKALVVQYGKSNPGGRWTSWAQVEASALDMVARHAATIREARLIGA